MHKYGNVFISDEYLIRAVTPDGTIQIVGGQYLYPSGTPVQGFGGDGGLAIDAAMYYPVSIALDASGNLYVVEQGNERVRVMTPAPY